MTGWRVLALLLATAVFGCSSALTPFETGPPTLPVRIADPGPRVSICYNPLKTPPEKLQELAQKGCFGNTVAERIDTDYQLDDCPILTPARATFLCKPKPK
jgi:hypothetical protein